MVNITWISNEIVIAISVFVTILFLLVLRSNKLEKVQMKAVFFMYCNFMVLLYALYYMKSMFYIPHLLMCISIIFALINIIILKCLKLYNHKIGIFFVMFVIIIIELGYVSYTPFYARQHDSRDFMNYQNGGHFGYIGYLFYNNHLPTENPTNYWCFYNPPLFHIISAAFLKLVTALGQSINNGFENLQVLSVIYMTIFNIYVYKILKEMKIEKSLIYMIAFIGLSPAMVIMSGSLNNDILSIMLSTIAIYYTIKWYDDDKISNLIKIALSISLAMMTKISAALVSIPIAIVFLVKVIKNKDNFKRYVWNFVIFALIALPIGLWFPIKNLVMYDIPITYVQSVDQSNGANVSSFSVLKRLFTISESNLKTINVVMGGEDIDYNIFLSTIKSFIVDEYIDYENNIIMSISINIIFFSSIILAILFIINFIYIIRRYKQINNHWILFFRLGCQKTH